MNVPVLLFSGLISCSVVMLKKLITKRVNPGENSIYYVSIQETYNVVKRARVATGHGGRDRMTKEINKKYANIACDVLNLFKSYCHKCQKKRKRSILTKEFASRAQIDLIDMQFMAQKSFMWILVYQDHLTKFVILRVLSSKRAAEVAHHCLTYSFSLVPHLFPRATMEVNSHQRLPEN